MARNPVQSSPSLPSAVPDPENRQFLIDLARQLRSLFTEYGSAINDDLLVRPDWHRTITAVAYSMLDTDRLLVVDSTAGVVTIILPAVAVAEPHLFGVKRIAGGNNVVVNPQATEQIDRGGAGVGVTLTATNQLVLLTSDRADWWLWHSGAP